MQNPLTIKKQDLKDVIFIGTVVNNDDPSKMGRVQIRVPHIFDGVVDEDLPWALPDRMVGPSADNGAAACMIPNNGSKVFVFFQMGSAHDPIYRSDVISVDYFSSTVFGSEYPSAWGFSDGKNYIKVNRLTGDIKVHNNAGAEVNLAQDGTVNITATNNLVVNVTSDATVTVGGDASVTVTGSATVKAADITAQSTSGDVTITSAANVSITGTSAITVTSTGPTTITNGAASIKLIGPLVDLNN